MKLPNQLNSIILYKTSVFLLVKITFDDNTFSKILNRGYNIGIYIFLFKERI